MSASRLARVLFAAESLLPARGGAERFVLELLAALVGRGNEAEATWLAAGSASTRDSGAEEGALVDRLPPGVEGHCAHVGHGAGYWEDKAVVRAAVAAAVAHTVARDRPDVVVTQLHAAPGALQAAAGVPTVLLLPSYESLCKYAFDAGSTCGEHRDCTTCPSATALVESEAEHLRASRAAHSRSLHAATALVAPSHAVAAETVRWCGRRPEVIPSVACAPRQAHARPGGHVLLAAARWSANKGREFLVPLATALGDRDVVITPDGLDDHDFGVLAAKPNVRFISAAIERLLDGAAICLVPSRWPEPFGRVAFEAQAAGVPVLAASTGGLAEFVPHAAQLPAEASPVEWARAVRALEPPDTWRAARSRALRAASAVLAGEPLARLTELIERTATRPG